MCECLAHVLNVVLQTSDEADGSKAHQKVSEDSPIVNHKDSPIIANHKPNEALVDKELDHPQISQDPPATAEELIKCVLKTVCKEHPHGHTRSQLRSQHSSWFAPQHLQNHDYMPKSCFLCALRFTNVAKSAIKQGKEYKVGNTEKNCVCACDCSLANDNPVCFACALPAAKEFLESFPAALRNSR